MSFGGSSFNEKKNQLRVDKLDRISRHRKSIVASTNHEYTDDSETSLNLYEVDKPVADHALRGLPVSTSDIEDKPIEVSGSDAIKFKQAMFKTGAHNPQTPSVNNDDIADSTTATANSGDTSTVETKPNYQSLDGYKEHANDELLSGAIKRHSGGEIYNRKHVHQFDDSKSPRDLQNRETIKVINVPGDVDKIHLKRVTTDVIRLNKIRYKNGIPRSNFSDVKHIETASILDSDSAKESEFSGFYTPFWLGVAVAMINIASHSIRKKGLKDAFLTSRILQIFFQDIIWIGLCDLVLYLLMYISVIIQLAVKKNIITWRRCGYYLQSVFEIFFLGGVTLWLESSEYPWIGKVFLILHSLVFLMKMHSFAFYNGYLWRIKDELTFSEGYLKKITDDLHSAADDKTKEILQHSVDFCKFELDQNAVNQADKFPRNITYKNFFRYTMFPTVVYEIEYPRNKRIRWRYFISKLLGVFGIIGVMIVIAQEGVYPLAIKALHMKEWPLEDKIREYPFLLLDMMPHFFLLYFLVFFLIWDQILNAIAELTRFADRDFYGPWWNCVTWDEFARLWNTPVHKFLLRHVYHSSISALHLSRQSATLVTFLLSSVFHELVMYVIFGKLRFYLFMLQMYQLPLIAVSRTKFFKGKKSLGNIVFWIGIASGAAVVCSLYLVF